MFEGYCRYCGHFDKKQTHTHTIQISYPAPPSPPTYTLYDGILKVHFQERLGMVGGSSESETSDFRNLQQRGLRLPTPDPETQILGRCMLKMMALALQPLPIQGSFPSTPWEGHPGWEFWPEGPDGLGSVDVERLLRLTLRTRAGVLQSAASTGASRVRQDWERICYMSFPLHAHKLLTALKFKPSA